MNNMGGFKQLENIKKQIKKMKDDVKKAKVQEGLLYNSLYSFRVKLSRENARHHLFDSLDDDGKKDEYDRK
jgi:hypothetical protein